MDLKNSTIYIMRLRPGATSSSELRNHSDEMSELYNGFLVIHFCICYSELYPHRLFTTFFTWVCLFNMRVILIYYMLFDVQGLF